jgi:malate dehydrogenase (oxaloacetate-decarboxylating)
LYIVAFAPCIPEENLSPVYVIPSVFDERIVPALAEAVEAAARTRAES